MIVEQDQTTSVPARRVLWRPILFGYATLVAFWAWKFFSTWQAWGDLTIDSGHEMYLPAILAQGKVLYRDAWYMYGPAAPYLNSYLFRIFGIHLNVLYWAGSLAALGSAIFLYLVGMRLGVALIGWTAGAVVLAEAFHPSLFCFPLPYAFAAVYGCLVGCAFLWFVLKANISEHWGWMFAAGCAAALALLLKPEFGTACYGTLAICLVLHACQGRSLRSIGRELLAIIPGVLACVAAVLWMISLRGVEFITQENVVSWPSSYFMKNYGKRWLTLNGFTVAPADFVAALSRTLPLAGAALLVFCYWWWRRNDARARLWKAFLTVMFLVLLAYEKFKIAKIFFPQDMVLYVAVATVFYVWLFRKNRDAKSGAFLLIFSYCTLLAFRILMGMHPDGYSIYYNGPVVLCFLVLLSLAIPREGRSHRFVIVAESIFCLACLGVTVQHARVLESVGRSYVPLVTDRGTIRVSKNKAEQYALAIQFMKEKARQGESVLSVPEDTSLYFLSETICPIRLFSFTPGVLAPGKMTDETIREIDQKHVRYLLWSSRIFPEFGTTVFGKDFDQPVGEYFRAHYQPVRRLMPWYPGANWDWSAVIWERNSD
ncbi:MAG TPA: hypothetical protein VFQ00_05270 [Terriglobales bacterium]|nr:hypothetical protein [Terriglobales bacterium]